MKKQSSIPSLIVSIVISVLVVTAYHMWQKRDAANAVQDISNNIEKEIISLLNKKPEIFMDALNQGMANKAKKEKEKMDKIASSMKKELEEASINVGDAGGEVSLVAFVDPSCPYCKRFLNVMKEVSEKLEETPLYVLPIALMGPDSFKLCKVMLAAGKKGKDVFYSALKVINNSDINKPEAKQKINDLGLDLDKIFSDKDFDDIIKKNIKLGEKLKVEGVPTVYIFNKNNEAKNVSPMGTHELIKMLKQIKKNGSLKVD